MTPKVLKVNETLEGDLKFVQSVDVDMSHGMIGLKGEEFLFSNGSLDKKAEKGKL